MWRSFSPRRPDAQLIEGGQRQEEEQQLNRELPDDIVRRQLIHNLAKHVIFSKDPANMAATVDSYQLNAAIPSRFLMLQRCM